MSKRAEEAAKEYAFINKGVTINGEEYKTYDGGKLSGFLAGEVWQKEKIIKLILSRIAEILGDAQPNPILRTELRELIEKIKEDEE